MEQEPTEIIVLGAIRRGRKSFGKIRKEANVDSEELDRILARLEERGLIRTEEKSGFFGRKIEITTTEKGDRELEERVGEMEQNWGKMVTMYKSGNKNGMNQMMGNYRSMLPMMIFFGVIDMMMFSMMFSMMGASMSDFIPADQVPEGMDGDGYEDDGGDGGDFDMDLGF